MTSEELIKEVDRLVPEIMDAIIGEPAHVVVTTLTHVLREILTVYLKDAQIIQVLQDFQMGLVLGVTDGQTQTTDN
jgi:excinuclease UvrABC helicase subunit UvrB